MTSADSEHPRHLPHVNHAASLVSQVNQFAEPTRAITPSCDSFIRSTTERDKEMPGEDLVGLNTEDPSHVQSTTESGATLPRLSATEEERSNDVNNWDALQSPSNTLEGGMASKGGFLGDIEEESISATTNTRLEHMVEATSDGSKRASHHRLDLRLSSPPPWELIDPPSDDGRKEFYTGYGSQKTNPLDNPMNVRSLIPKSSYYYGPATGDTAFGTAPIGHIGVHHPREILRIERDYTGGEVIQFSPSYPLELEGRVTPTQFLESINLINEVLISAHSLQPSFVDNMLAVFTLQLSRHVLTSHYEKEIRRLRQIITDLNSGLYNPVGLNILWPHDVAFLYLEIEYY